MRINGSSFRSIALILVIAIMIPAYGFCESNPPGKIENGNYGIAELVAGNTAFAVNLYQLLCEEDSNLFFSPYSISNALAMTVTGARNETARQIIKTLRFPFPAGLVHNDFRTLNKELNNRDDPSKTGFYDQGFKLNIANSIWGQEGHSFTKSFTDIISDNYGSEPRLLDFRNSPEQSRSTINDWISEKTERNINTIVPPGVITPETILVLANAIYFESNWN